METATWARRILALVVDWFASTLVVIFALGGVDQWAGDQQSGFYVLGVFVLESAIFTALSRGLVRPARHPAPRRTRERRPAPDPAAPRPRPPGPDRAGHPAAGLPPRRARAARHRGRQRGGDAPDVSRPGWARVRTVLVPTTNLRRIIVSLSVRRVLATAAATATILALAGCGGDDGKAADKSSSTASASDSAAPADSAESDAAGSGEELSGTSSRGSSRTRSTRPPPRTSRWTSGPSARARAMRTTPRRRRSWR